MTMSAFNEGFLKPLPTSRRYRHSGYHRKAQNQEPKDSVFIGVQTQKNHPEHQANERMEEVEAIRISACRKFIYRYTAANVTA